MMKFLGLIFLSAVSLTAWAGSELYMSERTMSAVYYTAASDRVSVGVADSTGLLDSTCNWYGHQFTFFANTPAGEKMLSMLTIAKGNNRRIRVWYIPSSTPGTNAASGCTEANMALMTRIAIL